MGRSAGRTSSSGHSTPPSITLPSRPLFPSISLRGSSPSTHASDPNQSARSSLLNVLTRPRLPTSAVSNTTASSDTALSTLEDDFSDQSTISSYASSATSISSGSRSGSNEELANIYKNYLEKPFVTTKSLVKHSEFGHCNNPNWRWTSQWNPNEPIHPAEEARPPYYILLSTYIS